MTYQMAFQARTWLETPFVHQGRSKHTGCDCLGLLIGVATELQLYSRQGMPLSACDNNTYGMATESYQLYQQLSTHLYQSSVPDSGKVLLFNIAGNASHLAILAPYAYGGLSMIHAYSVAEKVVEHRFDNKWQRRVAGIWEVKSNCN